jgi:SAM-dependent methyltransferase
MSVTVESRPPDQTNLAAFDQAKLEAFLGKVVGDLGAAMSCALAYIGDRLGLYKALADAGPLTPAELARRTHTAERYVREWLINQAAGGYVDYDPLTGRYSLPYEHAIALIDERGPFFVGGGFQVALALVKAEPRIEEAFRTGGGMLWGEHDPLLFGGTERFFRPGYAAHLVSEWIPALDGMEEKLREGAKVADVGCGHGASTILMAQAYPNSRFFGYDNHTPSIIRAREAVAKAGVEERVTFKVASAGDFPGSDYDLICFFDCFHDLGDPAGAAHRACQTLAPGGAVMIVEPMAGNQVEENLNPVGRAFSAASTLCCTPNAIACGGSALGAVASDESLRHAVAAGGLTHFRRAAETPFNRVFEARR